MTGRATADYIANQLHFYWPIFIMSEKKIKKQWIKWGIHQNPKRKRMVKFIRSKMAYKRYQIDFVELSRELNMNENFKHLLTWVDLFF